MGDGGTKHDKEGFLKTEVCCGRTDDTRDGSKQWFKKCCNFSQHKNYDVTQGLCTGGSKIKSLSDQTIDACEKACDGDDDCKAYEIDIDTHWHPGSKGACSLFKGDATGDDTKEDKVCVVVKALLTAGDDKKGDDTKAAEEEATAADETKMSATAGLGIAAGPVIAAAAAASHVAL